MGCRLRMLSLQVGVQGQHTGAMRKYVDYESLSMTSPDKLAKSKKRKTLEEPVQQSSRPLNDSGIKEETSCPK